jgi:hypothetical protein
MKEHALKGKTGNRKGKTKPEKMIHVSIRLPESHVLAADALCQFDKISRCQLIRQLLFRELRDAGMLVADMNSGDEK